MVLLGSAILRGRSFGLACAESEAAQARNPAAIKITAKPRRKHVFAGIIRLSADTNYAQCNLCPQFSQNASSGEMLDLQLGHSLTAVGGKVAVDLLRAC